MPLCKIVSIPTHLYLLKILDEGNKGAACTLLWMEGLGNTYSPFWQLKLMHQNFYKCFSLDEQHLELLGLLKVFPVCSQFSNTNIVHDHRHACYQTVKMGWKNMLILPGLLHTQCGLVKEKKSQVRLLLLHGTALSQLLLTHIAMCRVVRPLCLNHSQVVKWRVAQIINAHFTHQVCSK